jgi:hypothetical protein
MLEGCKIGSESNPELFLISVVKVVVVEESKRVPCLSGSTPFTIARMLLTFSLPLVALVHLILPIKQPCSPF